MNRRDFEQHLKAEGCLLHHHGGKHDVWWNPTTGTQSPVPRHNEIKTGTVRGICRILRIPQPTNR